MGTTQICDAPVSELSPEAARSACPMLMRVGDGSESALLPISGIRGYVKCLLCCGRPSPFPLSWLCAVL